MTGDIERAAAGGDADALYELALRQLIGDVLPRDVPAALGKFSEARRRGHSDAALIEIALTANGSGAPRDFAGARRLLDEAARRDPNAAYLRDLVAQMALRADGLPDLVPVVEQLDPQGLVTRFRNMLTEAECAHIARSVGDLLAPAQVVDPATGRNVPNPVRTSDGAVIGPTREDLVIRAINLRLAASTDTDVDQGEALAVLRYRPGQQYRLHSDAVAGAANQRIKTVLVYLNEGYGGGQTSFPELGLTIVPRAGDAIAFANATPEGAIDARMRHAGLPVTTGVKWLATRWIRATPIDPWRRGG